MGEKTPLIWWRKGEWNPDNEYEVWILQNWSSMSGEYGFEFVVKIHFPATPRKNGESLVNNSERNASVGFICEGERIVLDNMLE